VGGMVNWVLNTTKPPQPVAIVHDDAAALNFLASRCQEERVWVKSKDRKGSTGGNSAKGSAHSDKDADSARSSSTTVDFCPVDSSSERSDISETEVALSEAQT